MNAHKILMGTGAGDVRITVIDRDAGGSTKLEITASWPDIRVSIYVTNKFIKSTVAPEAYIVSCLNKKRKEVIKPPKPQKL